MIRCWQVNELGKIRMDLAHRDRWRFRCVDVAANLGFPVAYEANSLGIPRIGIERLARAVGIVKEHLTGHRPETISKPVEDHVAEHPGFLAIIRSL